MGVMNLQDTFVELHVKLLYVEEGKEDG
jgi:hypothetical protein